MDDAPVMTADCKAVHSYNFVRVTLLEFSEKTYISQANLFNIFTAAISERY